MYEIVTYQNSVLSVIDMDRHEDITPELTHAQVLAILEQVQAQPGYQARLGDGPSFGYTGSLGMLATTQRLMRAGKSQDAPTSQAGGDPR